MQTSNGSDADGWCTYVHLESNSAIIGICGAFDPEPSLFTTLLKISRLDVFWIF